MTTLDHNEGIERETALQRLLIWVNSHGLCAISILPTFKASAMEGNVREKISQSTSGILLSGAGTALLRVRCLGSDVTLLTKL
jgi:hypothetical protein